MSSLTAIRHILDSAIESAHTAVRYDALNGVQEAICAYNEAVVIIKYLLKDPNYKDDREGLESICDMYLERVDSLSTRQSPIENSTASSSNMILPLNSLNVLKTKETSFKQSFKQSLKYAISKIFIKKQPIKNLFDFGKHPADPHNQKDSSFSPFICATQQQLAQSFSSSSLNICMSSNKTLLYFQHYQTSNKKKTDTSNTSIYRSSDDYSNSNNDKSKTLLYKQRYQKKGNGGTQDTNNKCQTNNQVKGKTRQNRLVTYTSQSTRSCHSTRSVTTVITDDTRYQLLSRSLTVFATKALPAIPNMQ